MDPPLADCLPRLGSFPPILTPAVILSRYPPCPFPPPPRSRSVDDRPAFLRGISTLLSFRSHLDTSHSEGILNRFENIVSHTA